MELHNNGTFLTQSDKEDWEISLALILAGSNLHTKHLIPTGEDDSHGWGARGGKKKKSTEIAKSYREKNDC